MLLIPLKTLKDKPIQVYETILGITRKTCELSVPTYTQSKDETLYLDLKATLTLRLKVHFVSKILNGNSVFKHILLAFSPLLILMILN